MTWRALLLVLLLTGLCNSVWGQSFLAAELNERGEARLRNNDWAGELDSESFAPQFGCAESLVRAGHYSQAVAELEKARLLNGKDKRARTLLLASYLMTSRYRDAARLYPVAYNFVVWLVLVSFGAGLFFLLRKSFRADTAESPGLLFAIAWLALFMQGQLACIFLAGFLGSLYKSGALLTGLIVSTVPVLAAGLFAFPRQPWGGAFGRPRYGRWMRVVLLSFLGMILVGMATHLYTGLVELITHKPFPMQPTVPFLRDMVEDHPWVAGMFAALLTPMAEEFLFRGLLFGALQKWCSGRMTALITAAGFAFVHFQPLYFVPLMLFGMLLGFIRLKTGSVWFSVFLHGLNNGFALLALASGVQNV